MGQPQRYCGCTMVALRRRAEIGIAGELIEAAE